MTSSILNGAGEGDRTLGPQLGKLVKIPVFQPVTGNSPQIRHINLTVFRKTALQPSVFWPLHDLSVNARKH